jgi:Uma2 family endonuclease
MRTSLANPAYITADEFLEHPLAKGPSELVRGRIRMMSPASGAHGIIAGRIFAALNTFVEAHALGVCFPDNTGFHLPGLIDTVRSPDAAFIRQDHLPVEGIGAGWVRVAPDLVVEVRSPDEGDAELQAKLDDYRKAGTIVLWVINPHVRTVEIYEGNTVRCCHATHILDGGTLLPGFVLDVARLFHGLAL